MVACLTLSTFVDFQRKDVIKYAKYEYLLPVAREKLLSQAPAGPLEFISRQI